MSNPSAVLFGERDLRIEDRPVPVPTAEQVLIEVHAVGICGSDVHYYDHGRNGAKVVEKPMIVGHEAAGTIIDVGGSVDRRRIGQLVALEPGVPDRTCEQCRAGRYNLCPNVVFFASPPVDGAISRFVAIDATFAHPAPDSLTAEQAAMAEPVSVGVWASRKAQVTPGDHVLVTGAGPIGLFAAQVARAFGASSVTLTDVSDYRLDVASRLGFTALGAEAPLPRDYDVVIECSGALSALARGLASVARAGRVVLVGIGPASATIDVHLLQNREISLTGIFRYANTYPVALDLIASGAVDTDAVITHRFPLVETEQALTLGKREQRSLKAVVLPLG